MNVLAIGAHPDDIEFGCGGTLIKYAQKGHNVYLLILTMGGIGGNPKVRKKEQEDALRFMKAKKAFWGNFKDTELPLGKALVSFIEEVIEETKPQVVFFNYFDDTHQDHRVAPFGDLYGAGDPPADEVDLADQSAVGQQGQETVLVPVDAEECDVSIHPDPVDGHQ